jgi:hypothetical protein
MRNSFADRNGISQSPSTSGVHCPVKIWSI